MVVLSNFNLSTASELNPVVEILFESVKQKRLDKTIFDQQVVNFFLEEKRISHEPALCPFKAYEISIRP